MKAHSALHNLLLGIILGVFLTVGSTFLTPAAYARVTGIAPVPADALIDLLAITDILMEREHDCRKGTRQF